MGSEEGRHLRGVTFEPRSEPIQRHPCGPPAPLWAAGERIHVVFMLRVTRRVVLLLGKLDVWANTLCLYHQKSQNASVVSVYLCVCVCIFFNYCIMLAAKVFDRFFLFRKLIMFLIDLLLDLTMREKKSTLWASFTKILDSLHKCECLRAQVVCTCRVIC